jgi:hypothetical protein
MKWLLFLRLMLLGRPIYVTNAQSGVAFKDFEQAISN